MSSSLKPWLVMGIIFIVGIVTGVALAIGLGPRFMHSPLPHDMKKHWMAHLTHELNLTADQQSKIQPILADAANKFQALHRDELDRGSQIFKAADDQISALLTPDQKAELQKMESEREKMFSGHMHTWGPPHEGPGGMPPPGGPDDSMPHPPAKPSGASTNAPPPQNP
jgi:Spy/CpxP family protein refolding chaperone